MKILTLILSLLLALPSGGVRLTLSAEASDALSDGAVAALQAVLAQAALVISPEGYDLVCAEETLLQARADAAGGYVACGDMASALAIAPSGSADVWQTARALGELLAPWEKESGQSVDLQEAGVVSAQRVYVLTDAEWARVWRQTVAILSACAPEAQMLAEAEIRGKGTLKRYFDRDGNEMGLYFYAAEMWLDGEAREVRLEYGFRADKGLYAAFRCPNKNETRNARLALHGKRTAGGWSLSGSLRVTDGADSDVYAVEGRTNGALTLSLSRKRGGRTAQYALSLQMADGAARYSYQQDKRLLLAGRAAWQTADLPAVPPRTANAETTEVGAALADRLLKHLRAAAPNDWQELVHALAVDVLIDAQSNASKEAD